MNFEVQKFREISKFRFGCLCSYDTAFKTLRIQFQKKLFPSPPPPPSIRLAPPVLLWFVFSLDQTSSLKKTWLRVCVIGRLLVKPYYCWLWTLVMSLVRFDPCLLSQLNSRLLLVKLSVVKSITLNLLMKWPTRSYSAYLWKDLWVQTSHRPIVVGNHWFETLQGDEKSIREISKYTVKSIAV